MYNNSSAGLMYPMVCPFWNFTVVLFFFFTPLGALAKACQLAWACPASCMNCNCTTLLNKNNKLLYNIYDVCVYIVFPNNSFVNRLQQ